VDRQPEAHYELIKTLVNRGVYFFDYGNSFLKAVYDAGVTEICPQRPRTRWMDLSCRPMWKISWDRMLFDYGYGPFRWVCLSGRKEDLEKTDQAAMDCIDPNRRVPGPRQLGLDQ
jgi:urocanate hydratase